MRTFVSIAAVCTVAAIIALAAAPSRHPGYEYGLTGNTWWAAQDAAPAGRPSPRKERAGIEDAGPH